MIEIIQGGNSPITLEFDAPVDAVKFEASLYGFKEFKHWSISEVTIDGATVTLPLTEAETLNFSSGKCALSVKLLDSDDAIIFYAEEPAKVIYKADHTAMEG